jgi:hypothetical protein
MDHHPIADIGDIIGDRGSDGVNDACGLVPHHMST